MSAWLEILLVLAGLGAAGVAAELLARRWLARRGQYYVWMPHYRGRYEVDPDTFPMLDPVVHWEVNAAGERGSPLPEDLESTYRVVAAGGSTTECYFIDQEKTWPAVLQEILRRPRNLARLSAADAYVGNIGRSVTTASYIDDVFRKTLHRYPRLDLVILFVGASDLLRWMHARAPQEWRNDPVPVARIYGAHPEGPFGWSPGSLALRRIASSWKLRIFRPVHARTTVGKQFLALRKMRAEAKHLITEAPDITPVLAHWEKHLNELLELLKTRARRVLFVPNPWFEGGEKDPEARKTMWNFGLGKPHEEHVDTYFAHDVVARMLHRLADRGIELAREAGCEALDLMPRIERHRGHYYDYVHHTPAGNRRVAEEIARAVLEGARLELDSDAPGASSSQAHEQVAEQAE